MRGTFARAALVLCAVAGPATAQVVDTTRADSLARDTTDWTGRFLKAQEAARETVPVMPRLGAERLLPPRTRLVLGRDSIEWHNAETVSDLLVKISGVYLWRGGWIGRPELPNYQARGAASVEYWLDGIPYLGLGQDSTMVDPSLFPMSFLERVEVERMPGLLRVWLFTRRHDRRAAQSRIAVASGDLDIARYQLRLEKRDRRGPGFIAAYDQLSVPVPEGILGEYSNQQTWIQLGFVPTSRFGVELQLFHQGLAREPVLTGFNVGDTLSAERKGDRSDTQLHGFWAARDDGMGARLDLFASRSHWKGSDVRHNLDQVGAVGSWRGTRYHLTGSAFTRSRWTPLDLRASVAVTPVGLFTGALDAVGQTHDGNRSSNWVAARVGVTLPLGFSAGAAWRRGSAVAIPSLVGSGDTIPADTAQRVDDKSVTVGWDSPMAGFEVSYARVAAFRPAPLAQFRGVDAIPASTATEWITASARVAPRSWLILDGWYSTPRGARPDGQPPTHGVANATIQSKFLRTFPSGIFTLKLQVGMESWGTGVLGVDSLGGAVGLPGSTHFRALIQIQIGSFTAYYDRANLQGTEAAYVPRLGIPAFASTFGIRWEFSN